VKVRHAIIADDLTGAVDAAAAFAHRGFRAVVVLDPRCLRSPRGMGFPPLLKWDTGGKPGPPQIVALCTHSRHDTPDAARRKVRRACGQLRQGGYSLLFKKLDSTVQGNVVAEVEAARAGGGFAAALVCPAHPVQGRRVRGAVLHVRGAGTVHLGERFRAQGLRASGAIEAPMSVAKISRAFARGNRFLLAHATTERELGLLVRAVRQSKHRVLLAGSAGMAGILAKQMARGRPVAGEFQVSSLKFHPSAQATLIIAGSNNPVTKRQLEKLVAQTRAAVFVLDRFTGKDAAAALASGRNVVILVPVHRQPDRMILRQLGTLAPLFRSRLIGSLVLTGGDTAALVCRGLRPLAIAIGGEIVPGIAWGRLVGGLAGGLAVCTKPGGFGGDQSLARAVRFLAPPPAGAPTAVPWPIFRS